MFAQIKASGYAGGHTRVTDFIRAWRASAGKDIKALVPLRFDLGEAFQFDWSEEGPVVGGIYHRMQVSHIAVRQSRLLAGGAGGRTRSQWRVLAGHGQPGNGPPTEWNFHPQGSVAQALENIPASRASVCREVDLLISAYDPCVKHEIRAPTLNTDMMEGCHA